MSIIVYPTRGSVYHMLMARQTHPVALTIVRPSSLETFSISDLHAGQNFTAGCGLGLFATSAPCIVNSKVHYTWVW
jgi:hypothetical protein